MYVKQTVKTSKALKLSLYFVLVILLCISLVVIVRPDFIYTSKSKKTGGLTEYFVPSTTSKTSPLVVVFGGSEGGIWLQRNDSLRHFLLEQGYSLLGLGYYGTDDSPEFLSQIEIGGISEVVDSYLPYQYSGTCVVTLGVSKGAELALMLGSIDSPHYGIIALAPSHVHYQATNISLYPQPAWTYQGEELPFVRYPLFSIETFKGILNAPYYGQMFEQIYEKSLENEDALIKIENIEAPVLLVSGALDRVWPASKMAQYMTNRSASLGKSNVTHIMTSTGHFVTSYSGTYKIIADFLAKTTADCEITESRD